MPSRWWVPLPGIDPTRVRLEHLHAAVSGWFDGTLGEHRANAKPYAVSPLSDDPTGGVGLEVATLTGVAEERLAAATEPGASIRLGHQTRTVGRPRLMHRHTWGELAGAPEARQWRLDFATPVTFRSGDRASPLPSVTTIIAGLGQAWEHWSEGGAVPRPDLALAGRHLWVSDLDLRSEVLRLPIGGRRGESQEVTVSGAVGSLTLRVSAPEAASAASALLGLAAYAGVGAMTRRGLGVTRVRAYAGPPACGPQ